MFFLQSSAPLSSSVKELDASQLLGMPLCPFQSPYDMKVWRWAYAWMTGPRQNDCRTVSRYLAKQYLPVPNSKGHVQENNAWFQNSFRTGFIFAIVGTPVICRANLLVSKRCCIQELNLMMGKFRKPGSRSTPVISTGDVYPADFNTRWTPFSASSSLTFEKALIGSETRGFDCTSALASSTKCLHGASAKQS